MPPSASQSPATIAILCVLDTAPPNRRTRSCGGRLHSGVSLKTQMAGTSRPFPTRRAPKCASPLHQHRAGALRTLAFVHDAEALRHFGIGFEQAAQVLAEAVLVELLVRLDVPQPARIRRDLVGDYDPHHLVLEQAPAFHLEIDQADADAE